MSAGSVAPARVPKFGILGPIELSDGERRLPVGGRRQLMLLAFLLVHANRPVSVDALLEGVWGEAEPDRRVAVKRLQVAITRLRKALEPLAGEVLLVSGGYLLAVGPGELDADVFNATVAEGQALAPRDPRRAADALRRALGLWRGPALAEMAYEEFAQGEIRRLEELRLGALEALFDAELAAGRHREVAAELEALVLEEPLRERMHAQRMLALYRCGRQGAALEAFQQARRVLVEQLGVEPGPELRGLQSAMLRHEAGLQLVPTGGGLRPEPEAAESSPITEPRDGESQATTEASSRTPTAAASNGAEHAATVAPTAVSSTREPAPEVAGTPANRERRRAWLARAAVGVGVVLAAIAGAVRGGRDGDIQTPAPPRPGPLIAVAGLQLRAPEGWTRGRQVPVIPGLKLVQAVAATGPRGGHVVLGVAGRDAANPTLLPGKLRRAAGLSPAVRAGAEAVAIGEQKLEALRYSGLRLQRLDGKLTVYAVPTSAGVGIVACLDRFNAPATIARACEHAANTLRLTTGRAFPVGPAEDHARRLNRVFARLGREIAPAKRRIRAAHTRRAQARAAGELAEAYARAAQSLHGLELSPADREPTMALVRALRRTADAYEAAERAARRGAAGAYAQARRNVRVAARSVERALNGLAAAGYRVGGRAT